MTDASANRWVWSFCARTRARMASNASKRCWYSHWRIIGNLLFYAFFNDTYSLTFSCRSRRQILGKRVMPFKVCSCPKRDMVKEHNINPPARKREANGPPAGKQPSKLMCTRPGNLQTLVKAEPDTPSPALSSNGDASSPQSLPNLDQHVFVGHADNGQLPVEQVGREMVDLHITVPRESAHHVLRTAYGDVTSIMTNDKHNTAELIQCARNIQGQMGKNCYARNSLRSLLIGIVCYSRFLCARQEQKLPVNSFNALTHNLFYLFYLHKLFFSISYMQSWYD